MNGTQTHALEHPGEETRSRTILGLSMFEAFGALATIALAIVGLARISPMTLAAIATIVAGAATMMETGAFGLRRASTAEALLAEGVRGAGVQGGIAAVVLGILALLGLAQTPLISVAVLVLGGTFAVTGRLIVGLSAIVLGILAVCGVSSETLFLVALLVLGAGLLLGGARAAASTTASQFTSSQP